MSAHGGEIRWPKIEVFVSITEQLVHDDQDGVRHGDSSLLDASACGRGLVAARAPRGLRAVSRSEPLLSSVDAFLRVEGLSSDTSDDSLRR